MDKFLDPKCYLSEVVRTSLSPRLDTLNDKTIFITAPKQEGSLIEVVVEKITDKIMQKYPRAKVVFKYKTSEYHNDDPELWNEIKETADAFIYGAAPSSSTTHWSVKWGTVLEKMGIPGTMIIYKGLIGPAETTREAVGVPIRYESFDYPPNSIDEAVLDSKVENAINNLIRPLTNNELVEGMVKLDEQSEIIFNGNFTESHEYYYKKGLTDGLPIVPPTRELVNEMLKGTSHKPSEIVTETMWPEGYKVTVEKVAINGVMAGCKKEHLPILLAAVEAFGKGDYNSTIRSTNAFSYMQLVNGPIISEVSMNADTYALGPGNEANACIGRALRLFIINLGGGQVGVNIMSTQGNPSAYSFCIAENEEKSPWSSFAEDQGFSKEESALTVFGGGWAHVGNYLSGDLEKLAKDISVFEWPAGAMVIMTPKAAQMYYDKGMNKEDIIKYVWENATITAGEFRNGLYYTWFIEPFLKRAEKDNTEAPWPIKYMYLAENEIVNAFPRKHVHVVVAGGEANPMMQGWMMLAPTTVSIDKWR